MLLSRGLATVTFDGPGQGETWERMPGRVDWEKAASAVVDFVEKRTDLDASRIVAVGVSLGGYLVMRSAALEVYEREPVPTWRRSGFWTTTLRHLGLDELETRHYDPVTERPDLPLHDERAALIVQRGASTVYDPLQMAELQRAVADFDQRLKAIEAKLGINSGGQNPAPGLGSPSGAGTNP